MFCSDLLINGFHNTWIKLIGSEQGQSQPLGKDSINFQRHAEFILEQEFNIFNARRRKNNTNVIRKLLWVTLQTTKTEKKVCVFACWDRNRYLKSPPAPVQRIVQMDRNQSLRKWLQVLCARFITSFILCTHSPNGGEIVSWKAT